MRKMPREKYLMFHLMLLSGAISAVVADDLFGMRLTTESLKTKERTHYRFHYFVKDDSTGDYKIQEETKEGDSVHGSYTLAEPNGDLRTVTYKAGPGTGFEAKVDIHPSASPMKPKTEAITPSPATLVSDVKIATATKAEPVTARTSTGSKLETVTAKTSTEPKLETVTAKISTGPKADTVTVKTNTGTKAEAITVKTATGRKAEAVTTPRPTKKDLPRVVTEALTTPQSQSPTAKTEMPMKFSLNTDFVTEPVTNAATTLEGKITETPVTTPEAIKSTLTVTPSENLENSTSETSGESNGTTEDPIQKKIDDAENSLPKLPEVVFPDNKTHFKFYKDPEEAFLDERITQIARQLAETSLRREYEERKLGHFIPISVTSVEPSTPGHLSKSFKFTNPPNPPNFRPYQQPPLPVLTQIKLIPQYIYKEAVFPRFLPANQRLPVFQTTLPIQDNDQWDQQTYETVTNVPEILKINKSKPQVEEINKILQLKGGKYSTNYDAVEGEPVSVVPIHAPTFLQFFSPYVVPTQGNYVPARTNPQPQLHVTPVNEDISSATMDVSKENITTS